MRWQAATKVIYAATDLLPNVKHFPYPPDRPPDIPRRSASYIPDTVSLRAPLTSALGHQH
jgi:hypothetical protein